MAHAAVKAQGHNTADYFEHLRRELDTSLRYVRINVATSEENRRAAEHSRVARVGSIGTDQPATQADHATIASRMARDELQHEACTLREAEKHRPLCNDA